MLIDNKRLVFEVLNYLLDVDAYMMGHHEVDWKKTICNLPNHPRLCANVIAQSISESPLVHYDIKVQHHDKWVPWVPFVSPTEFITLLNTGKVDAVFVDRDLPARKAELKQSCLTWCRRYIFREVDLRKEVVRVANA